MCQSGIAHVKATFNNTIIAITDPADASSHGHLQEKSTFQVPENHPHLLPQLPLKMLLKLPWAWE